MAKRKRSKSGQFTKGGATKTRIVRVPSSPTTIRVAAPRAVAKRRRSGGGKRRSSGGGVGGFLNSPRGSRTALVVGGLVLGYASKEKWLEKLPVIGKASRRAKRS